MVRILVVIFLFLTTSIYCQMELSWKMLHPISKKWISFGEKGSVQEALIACGELPNPFIGMNEHKFDWIENYKWTLQSEFVLTDIQCSENIEIDFPNIDTYASIFVNDKLVGKTENAFIHYTFALNAFCKKGVNKVKVVFTPPVMYQKPLLHQVGVTTLPAPNDVGKVKVAPYCRKPQYQFGWDWSLRMLTMGFWSPVKIQLFSINRVVEKGIKTTHISDGFAEQEFILELSKTESETLIWKSHLFGEKEVQVENGIVKRIEKIENPILWWPRGQGVPHLYNDVWTLTTKNGTVIYTDSIRFGVKKIELIQEPDQWGTSFYLKVNNRAVFCKGADYIPDDIFPARITDDKLKNQVADMVTCNFNMVRIWGGGFYPTEAFLDACDENGLMVWQDFMFACAMYPGNQSFLDLVKIELKQQIRRLGSHASLVLFNGNNEVDVAWKNWGFQKQFNLTEKDQQLIERYYQLLFKELIPSQVKLYSNLPYEHTSPLSNWGNDAFYNHGTQHYWGVWHGNDPLIDFARKMGRFNAEYGFQSFPEQATLLTFSSPKDWNLDSPLMKLRQKSYVGNQMIAKHSDLLYGKTSDFLQFVYFAQLTQARAVGLAVVSHRMNFPKCTGSLYWQYNDCWPAPTWSSVDYFGRWKALQYQVKEDFKDVALCETMDTLYNHQFVLISDVPEGNLCTIRARFYTPNGDLFDSAVCHQALAYPHSTVLFEKLVNHYKNTDYVVEFSWNDQANKEHTRTFTHLPRFKVTERIHPSVTLIDFDPTTKKGHVEVQTDQLLQDFWLTSKSGLLKMEQNFIQILPGKQILSFSFEGEFAENELIWFYR